ncbi:hypothetical protein HZC31_03355 [Candidatus Woesearchaeota archaeon]|nr:hypothetical protein [Candidatus Woesearchaeota archaeon]
MTETVMTTVPIQRKKIKVEYVTKRFPYSFDVENSTYVEGKGWDNKMVRRTIPLYVTAECTLTDRASQPLYSTNPATTKWYSVSVFENDRLDNEGKTRIVEKDGERYALTKGRDETIDTNRFPFREDRPKTQFAPDIAAMLEERFPVYNVELDIRFVSGREAVMDKRDNYDKRDIYRSLAEQIATYVITEAQKLVR